MPPRYAAAVQKSLPLLEESIENKTFGRKVGSLPSVLTFALHWPEGRRLLLAAGADPFESIAFAIQLGYSDALIDLLQKDLPFFYPDDSPHADLFSLWPTRTLRLGLSESAQENSLDSIINHLGQLRERLLALAREHLPYELLKQLCIDAGSRQESVLDCALLRLYRTLISRGVNTPSFLYPGSQRSIYHLSQMVTFIAERLFRAGYRHFDIKDENGIRPVEKACMIRDLELALWYLNHGAVPHESLIWILAASLAFLPWSNDDFKEIVSICGYPERDGCRCHCSSKGCLPSTILQKQSRSSPFPPSDFQWWFQWWVQCIPKHSQFEAYKEGCRLEVFERLGMSHTCCKYISSPYTSPPYCMRQQMPIDDGCDIREEEQDFVIILDQYLCLFDQLWLEFRGRFKTYWNAWWSAMAMMLPPPVSSTLMCDSITGFSVDAYWRRHYNTQTGFDFIEEYGPHEKFIRWIVGQYSNVENSLVKFCRLSEPWHVLRSWISYCVAVGIDPPRSDMEYNEVIHLPEDFDMNCFPEDLITHYSNLLGFEFLFLIPTERVEGAKRYISEKLLPIIVPVIILEIGFGRSIPEDLRRHFEAEGLLQDGVLVRPIFKENPESIFEDCFGALFDASPF